MSRPVAVVSLKYWDSLQVKELGRGCFGSVWLSKWRGVEVALKELLNQGRNYGFGNVSVE
jgi:predicted Ser/Thr protein kinase